ncbi:M20/M25/M40 family metallo-hydrolase, partial [Billgrantia desiderata]
ELFERVNAFAAELEAEMQRRAPETSIVTEALNLTVPALADDNNAEVLDLCRELLGEQPSGAVAYATEAGQFQRVGLPTVICGPGSIRQAHQPDEYIEIEQLAAGTRFMQALGRRLSQ